jgi:hypothetical protein
MTPTDEMKAAVEDCAALLCRSEGRDPAKERQGRHWKKYLARAERVFDAERNRRRGASRRVLTLPEDAAS